MPPEMNAWLWGELNGVHDMLHMNSTTGRDGGGGHMQEPFNLLDRELLELWNTNPRTAGPPPPKEPSYTEQLGLEHERQFKHQYSSQLDLLITWLEPYHQLTAQHRASLQDELRQTVQLQRAYNDDESLQPQETRRDPLHVFENENERQRGNQQEILLHYVRLDLPLPTQPLRSSSSSSIPVHGAPGGVGVGPIITASRYHFYTNYIQQLRTQARLEIGKLAGLHQMRDPGVYQAALDQACAQGQGQGQGRQHGGGGHGAKHPLEPLMILGLMPLRVVDSPELVRACLELLWSLKRDAAAAEAEEKKKVLDAMVEEWRQRRGGR
ncbi:hypothetical protein QBC32DRAFT_345758 [Pseudoneurospora amorphoporcata]|uniref:Uncharacterized protein n=1 Tax=Pseudoneurospora amorphoporcata TaxID=241081 RepID=A0AAN6SEZ0_9PEZI|nr:hypothetical protein QBC32DRAFT_345758 [Pseudoneurospora amorphoporcata]